MDLLGINSVCTLILSIVVLPSLAQIGPPASNSGHKYDLEIQKIVSVNETDFVVFEGLKVKRLNKTCE